MDRLEYKKCFTDHQMGFTACFEIWSAPVMPLKEPKMTEHVAAEFKQCLQQAKNQQSVVVLLTGALPSHNAMALAKCSYELKQPVWFIDSSAFEMTDTKQLHRIFAQARLTGSILFFDEADALFASQSEDSQTQIDLLLKQASLYTGLCLFHCHKAQVIDKLTLRLAYHFAL